jgi:hypothetical protein
MRSRNCLQRRKIESRVTVDQIYLTEDTMIWWAPVSVGLEFLSNVRVSWIA